MPRSATTLVLIRHAHISDNDLSSDARLVGRTDIPLSQHGYVQAGQVAALLSADSHPAALYTSPLQRAAQTAAAITAAVGPSATSLPDLVEIDCGRLEGERISHVRAAHPELWASNQAQDDATFRWPGGESYAELRQRVVAVIDSLAARHPGQTIWVVTHAGVITQTLGAVRGTSPARWDLFRPGNASLTRIRWSAGGGSSSEILSFDERAEALALS